MRSLLILVLMVGSVSFGGCSPEILRNFKTSKSIILVNQRITSAYRFGTLAVPFTLKTSFPSSVTLAAQYVESDPSLSVGVDFSSQMGPPVVVKAGETSGTIYVSLMSIAREQGRKAGTFKIRIYSPDTPAIPEEQIVIELPATASSAPLLQNITQVSTSFRHSCAVTSVGGIKCWGDNTYGQLGDGTTTSRVTPIDVVGLAGAAQAVATGYYSTCALLVSGAVQCWGYNGYGQLGDGTLVSKSSPVNVTTSSAVSAISSGGQHVCVLLTPSNGLQCWGYNLSGGLGDGTNVSKSVPTAVSGMASGVSSVAAGWYHTCALMGTGDVKCWGSNSYGNLGDNTTASKNVPTAVVGLGAGTTSAISAGYFLSCALISGTGEVRCWGFNYYGSVGDGTTTNRLVPTQVSGFASGAVGLVNASPGGFAQCAVTTGNALNCWGFNGPGKLGDGTITNRLTSVPVTNWIAPFQSLSVGYLTTCGLLSGGLVQCWGDNSSAQFGDGNKTSVAFPVDPAGLTTDYKQVVAGYSHSCGLSAGGAVRCWGYNEYGALGDGTNINRETASTVVSLAAPAKTLVSGYNHMCALLDTGAVQCWGRNDFGQLGDGTVAGKNIPVTTVASGVQSIAGGHHHVCVVLDTGAAQCWGYNNRGQLGDNSLVNKTVPTNVSGLTAGTVQAIATGGFHSCAVMVAGTLMCWGLNTSGQIGDGTAVNKSVPTSVTGLASTVTQVAAGGLHTCGLLSDGTFQCWGANASGQIGDGTFSNRLVPTTVSGVTATAIRSIAMADQSTCVLTLAGAVQCWGNNYYATLANGNYTNTALPTSALGLSIGVQALSCGISHCGAVLTNGAVKMWGFNTYLGLGTGLSGISSGGTVAY